jgi:hypothetical protein
MDELFEKDSEPPGITGLDEVDLLPEYCHYRDEGCELYESCLLCPFPYCIREETRGKRRQAKEQRAREIIRLHCKKGRTVGELAAIFKISLRTVYRILKSGNRPEGGLPKHRHKKSNRSSKTV